MQDLFEALNNHEVGVTDLIRVHLRASAAAPDRYGRTVAMAGKVLERLERSAINLSCLPASFEGLLGNADIASFIEAEANSIVRLRRKLTETKAWDDERAEAEAQETYEQGRRVYEHRVTSNKPSLGRAQKLRAEVLAMSLSTVMVADIATADAVLDLQHRMLAQVDAIVLQLMPGPEPVRLTGAEYRDHLIAEYTAAIKQADGPDNQMHQIREAFELLQALALAYNSPG